MHYLFAAKIGIISDTTKYFASFFVITPIFTLMTMMTDDSMGWGRFCLTKPIIR